MKKLSEYGKVGMCWDVGHANLSGIDQGMVIKELGQHIKVVHLHDNNTFEDSHYVPYTGTINWDQIMEALRAINFCGSNNLECGGFTNSLPEKLLVPALQYCKKSAEHLVEIYDSDN